MLLRKFTACFCAKSNKLICGHKNIQSLPLVIRQQRPEDRTAIMEVTREAFWNLIQPGCDQHYIANLLYEQKDQIQPLSLVAEINRKIVGNIFFSRSWLKYEDGEKVEILKFGPLAVDPTCQEKKIGSILMK